MKNGKLKYIAFYDVFDNKRENRLVALAAKSKIDYICSAIRKSGYEIEIISPSWSNNPRGIYRGKTTTICDGVTLKTFHTFGCKTRPMRMIKYIFSLIQLVLYLLRNATKDNVVVAYHSVILSKPIRVAKASRGFRLVLEVEEIYQDAQRLAECMKRDEWRIIQKADGYIFSTELLNEKVNQAGKPFVVVYGTYQVEEPLDSEWGDEKIHVVYAGTLDPRKGALAAIAAAEHLPSRYHLHIIGFGSAEQTREIETKAKAISESALATVTYDGLLKGEEYIAFLQKCHIGLSTQVPDAMFNETSFPSKILSYMANGLVVVSVRLRAIEQSSIASRIYFYDEQDPRAIARAIMSVDIDSGTDSRELVGSLNDEFVHSVSDLLESVK